MNKNKVRKAAYKGIANERKSHQEFFDDFRNHNRVNSELLAQETSKIPSLAKMKETTTLRYVYTGILSIVLILRAFGVTELLQSSGMGTGLIIFALLLALGIPVIGIVAAVTQRVYLYQPVGMLMGLAILRTFTNKTIQVDETVYLVMIPMVLVIVLSFYIPSKLKTPYTKNVSKIEKDGVSKTKTQYVFEESAHYSDEILDAGL